MQISSIWSEIIEEPPSAVAFSPDRPELVVIGTYLLHKVEEVKADDGTQKRTGKLIIYRLDEKSLHRLQVVELDAAVLDIEWSPHQPDLLAVATSTGTVDFYKLEGDLLHPLSSIRCAEPYFLILDLVWHPSRRDVLALTSSDGRVMLSQSTTGAWTDNAIILHDIASHKLEPWTLAFDLAGNGLLSGGDDMVLQYSSTADASAPSMLWSDRKAHQAGVTAILPITVDLVVTGSYDDSIRLLHAPAMGRRRVLAELNLGGGVWRLKMLDQQGTATTILASCMHAGTRVVRLDKSSEDDWQFEVLAKFEEHESMNYGTDVQPEGIGTRTIVSTSFYDRRVCLWQFEMDRSSL